MIGRLFKDLKERHRRFRMYHCSFGKDKWGWYKSVDIPFTDHRYWIEIGASFNWREYYFHFNQIYDVAPEHQGVLGMTDNRTLIRWEVNL